jgi:hypothetical protein
MMTRRDNFLKTLRHEKHDRMPAVFVIDNFNYPQPLPKDIRDFEKLVSFADPEEYIELSKYYGLDILIRITPWHIAYTQTSDDFTVRNESVGAGKNATIWKTPLGDIRQVTQRSEDANTLFTIEYPVKEIKDYEIMLATFDCKEYGVNHENIKETRRILDMIGDDGIAYACSWSTPIMDLARSWVGLEKLVYDLAEHTSVVEHALDVISDHYCRQYEIIAANTPCEVIVFWDDANSLYLSRDMFEKYSMPVLKRFAEIAYRHGKILVNHTCGKIDAFLDLYAATNADAIDWLTPPPTGDVEPKRAQKLFGNRTAIMLAVIPQIMRNGSPDEVEAHIRSLLSDVDINNNFILMIPPPVGTPIENAKRIVEILVKEYDMPFNRSEIFGGILDK